MKNIKPILPNTLTEKFNGVGVVTSVRDEACLAMVQILTESGKYNIPATFTDGFSGTVSIGDKVFCVSDVDGNQVYITMMLERSIIKDRGEDDTDVAKMSLTNASDGKNCKVYNTRNELIFEYDPETNRSRVMVDTGNLDFVVPEGDICFKASGQVKIEGSSIDLAAKDAAGIPCTSFSLRQFSSELRTTVMNLESKYAKLNLSETQFTGDKLVSTVKTAKITWDKLEVLADTMLSKMRRQFIEVEDVSQTKSGRMRLLVVGVFRLKTQRANIKSDTTVNIDGERINLG